MPYLLIGYNSLLENDLTFLNELNFFLLCYPYKKNQAKSFSVNLQISAQFTFNSLSFTAEYFLTNSKLITYWDFRVIKKFLYLEKYLFLTNITFIFVFSISNSLRKM